MMKSIRLIFALLAALTSVQATGHAIPNAMSSAEIAGPACVCLNGCGAPCDAMRQGGGVCLRSAACAFGCANILAVDRSDCFAAPSGANRFLLPTDDLVFQQAASSPFRPPPARPLAYDSLATRKPGACAESCSAVSAQELERIDERQADRRSRDET